VDNSLWPYWRGYEITVLSVPLNKLHGRVMHSVVKKGLGGGTRRSTDCTPSSPSPLIWFAGRSTPTIK